MLVGIPSCNADDRSFAERYNLPYIDVIDATTGLLRNSAEVLVLIDLLFFLFIF